MPETWIVSDENWSLPVIVEWPEQNDVAAVRVSDLPMLSIQRHALETKLHSAGKFRNDAWWILRSVLQVIGHAITDDAEKYVVWRPLDARVKFRSGPHNADRDEFFAEYARNGIVSDPVKAEVIFVSFCKHMLSWMLNEQRPVQLGFCDLYAVPYRPNWKQLLFQRQQGRKVLPKTVLNRASMNDMVERGVPDDLIDPKLIFWNKPDAHMYWSIEARPRSMWWRMVKAVELAKKAKRHGGVYLESVSDTLKRLLPQSMELYASYLQQVSVPWVKLAASVRSRSGSFVRKEPASKMCKPATFSYHEPATHVRREGAEESATLDHVSSAAFVSTLSDLQRERLDMRDARADLAKSTNGER